MNKDKKENKSLVETLTPMVAGIGLISSFNPMLGGTIVASSVLLWSGMEIANVLSGNISQEREKWENFFKSTGIKTGLDEVPMFAKKVETQKGYKYIFKNPIGFSTHQINSKETAINEFLGSKYFKAEVNGEWLTLDVTEKTLPKMVEFEVVPSKKDRLEVAIGKTLDGYARLNFSAMPHTLISGATGSGKSGVTHAILTQLACNYSTKNLHLYLADLKRVELSKYKDLAITKKYVKTEKETEELIDQMLEICEDRYSKLEDLKVNKIELYNKKVAPNEKLPYIVLCI